MVSPHAAEVATSALGIGGDQDVRLLKAAAEVRLFQKHSLHDRFRRLSKPVQP